MLYRKIDENGLFIEDVILDEQPMIEQNEESIPDPYYIAEPVPQGFYYPEWNGTEWIEGLSAEEIVERTRPVLQEPTESDYIMLAIVDLDTQRATDKTETELAITELAEIVLGGM